MNKSFSAKTWNFLECDEEKFQEIKTQTGVSNLVAKILINRGLTTPSEIKAFLNCKLKNTIPNPSLLLDMDKGVTRVIEAILTKQNIMVIGDYDVDGITSTYLIVKYLQILGIQPKYYIPNRLTDGYGLSESSLNIAIQDNPNLIIAVDSGINSVKEIEIINNMGIDSIIIDHHIQLSKTLPNATAVINPNRCDQAEIQNSCIKHLCAAGVAFLFLIALQRELREIRFFNDMPEPNLLELTGIVTLGTLCDVMELRGMNRAVTKFTLANGHYPTGIVSLMNEFKIDKIAAPEDLSFFIGPAINAAGRIGDPLVALNLLLEENPEKSRKIASTLVELNKQRKVLERRMTTEAFHLISEEKLFQNRGICVFSNDWHEGVIGIVAGRIKDKFNKPSFVISLKNNGIGKGSARSVSGIHLGEFFERALTESLIIEGGGHALAGGFTISKDKVEEFSEFVKSDMLGEYINVLDIDCTLSHMSNLEQISNELKMIEPFGKGIGKPVFCIERVRITRIRETTNKSHMMLFIAGELGDGNIKAILFNINSKLQIVGEINKNKGALFDIVGYVSFHEKYGASFIIEDIKVVVN